MRLRLYRLAVSFAGDLAAIPALVMFVLQGSIGREYGVGRLAKLRLVTRFMRNIRAVETLSSVTEHLELAKALLAVPRSVPGDVVECGCYVGGSSVNLSLACALTGRRLLIYDSFQGLPEPEEHDRVHVNPHLGEVDEYYEGRFAATKETVAENIRRYGDLSVCEMVPGFFEDTVPQLDRPVVLAFLDVDLVASLEPCIVGLWPQLQADCRIYVHEAQSLSLAAVFFAADWWRGRIGEDPPGLVGAGSGLPLRAMSGSELGYAQKGLSAVAKLTPA